MPVRPELTGYNEEVTVLRGKRTMEQSKRDGQTKVETKYKNKDQSAAMRKLDEETENLKHKKVSTELRFQIQKARTAHGWTQKELAAKVGIKPIIINEYESGKAIPKGSELSKIKKVLGYQHFK
jgi:putative transcription factor